MTEARSRDRLATFTTNLRYTLEALSYAYPSSGVTDAELYVLIRDTLIARTGTWSANAVYEIARSFGVSGRRADMLSAVKNACGLAAKKGGKRPFGYQYPTGTATGTATGTGTSTATGTQREKKEAKKRERYIYSPTETSFLLAPKNFGDLEPEVVRFLEHLASRRTREMALSVASVAVDEIAEARDTFGAFAVAYALRATIAKPAEVPYFKAVVKNAPTGTGAPQNGVRATSTGGSRNGHYFQPENGGTTYASVIPLFKGDADALDP